MFLGSHGTISGRNKVQIRC